MKKLPAIVFILCIIANLAYADRTYTYVRTVGKDPGLYDFTTINDAIADIMQCNLTVGNPGCVQVHRGVYAEQLNSFYPGGHDLPAHCDLIGMGKSPADVVIQHKRRSESDPNFTNIVSEIYADGVLCDGDNIVENLKVENVWPNQNSIEFRGAGTLKNCIVKSYHDAVTAYGHLAVCGCTIEGWYRPCIHSYSTFEISDSNFYPKTRNWGGQHPAGIKVTKSGTIDNVTIEADIASSDYEPHYDTPWLAGVILQLRNPTDTVTITNARMNLKLTTLYHDDRPDETADWELFGVVSGGRNPTPTTNYPGHAVVQDCQINLTGVEDSSNPNGDGRAIMAAGVCVQGSGRIDVIGNTSIRTSRTAASFGCEGYEYSLNNQNGILSADFSTVDFDDTKTNGVITDYNPGGTGIGPPTLKKVLLNCPDNISPLPVPDMNWANFQPLSLPVKNDKGPEQTFSIRSGGSMLLGGGVIDVTSDITTNTIWTADNTYHVLNPIDIKALLVIEPGTMVTFAAGTAAGMRVIDGGTLISCGTADNPIVYTSDASYPNYQDYYCPMYITETASVTTKVSYSIVEWAYAGLVVLNNRLDTNIENNYFVRCVFGVVEYGLSHTDITNNLFYGSYYSGIEIYMESETSQADANSYILIENNTCDYYQDCGITVHGVPDSNDAGWVALVNNIVSGSYQYGLNLVDGYMHASVLNTGYYDNANNKNWEFDETDPVIETEFPYREGTGYAPICYLDQDCNFIDAGYQYIEETHLVGKTTDVNELPDCNYIDIGFHYPNWNFVNAGDGNSLSGDLDENLKVDFKDFAIFANYWLGPTTGGADLDGSGFVDYNDLAVLAGQWLQTVSAHPNISVTVSGDPCNLSDDITIGVIGYGYATEQAFAFIDGEFVQEIAGFGDGYGVELETHSFSNGQHSIKVVTVDPNNIITVSPPAVVTFNNELHYVGMSDDYESGRDYRITAMYSGDHNLRVDVTDIKDNVVWSDTFTGNLNITIPAATFDANTFYEISINETGMLLEDYKSWIKKVSKKFKPGDANPNAKALVVCPDKKVTKGKYECIQKAIEAFEQKGIEHIVLYRKNANYENMAFCLTQLPIKHLYFIGHSNYKVGDKLRTAIELSDGIVFSFKASDFDPNNVPDWCENLGRWEKKGKSIAAMGIPAGKLKIVFFDGCYTGRLRFTGGGDLVEGLEDDPGQMDPSPSDMSYALGLYYSDQIYKGWYGASFAINFLTYYITWSNNFWERLGLNDSIFEAINYCIWHTPGAGLRHGPHKNYRLKGFGDITSIRLKN